MRIPIVAVATFSLLAALLWLALLDRGSPDRPASAPHTEGNKLLSRLPVAFEPNVGQFSESTRYMARLRTMTVLLEEDGWLLRMERQSESTKAAPGTTNSVAVRMKFVTTRRATLVPRKRLPGVHHYLLGSDPESWHTDVLLYDAVTYLDVLPGIDVLARTHEGHFEYDLLLKPLSELDRVEMTVEGIDRMFIDHDGALILETALGQIRMPAPPSWEEGSGGQKQSIDCRYVLRGPNSFGFEVPRRNAAWNLVVDPGLLWSTFLGGSGGGVAYGVAMDATGAATVIVGSTTSANYPTVLGSFDRTHNGGGSDAFATRLDLLPTGVTAFGRSTAGCSEPLAISVTGMPKVGNQSFAFTCTNAPSSTVGLLALTPLGRTTPLHVFGTQIWVDLSGPWFLTLPGLSDTVGGCQLPLPIPKSAGLVSQSMCVQFVWLGPRVPPNCPPSGLSSSNALHVVFQP